MSLHVDPMGIASGPRPQRQRQRRQQDVVDVRPVRGRNLLQEGVGLLCVEEHRRGAAELLRVRTLQRGRRQVPGDAADAQPVRQRVSQVGVGRMLLERL
jgi:hypothetical protein